MVRASGLVGAVPCQAGCNCDARLWRRSCFWASLSSRLLRACLWRNSWSLAALEPSSASGLRNRFWAALRTVSIIDVTLKGRLRDVTTANARILQPTGRSSTFAKSRVSPSNRQGRKDQVAEKAENVNHIWRYNASLSRLVSNADRWCLPSAEMRPIVVGRLQLARAQPPEGPEP